MTDEELKQLIKDAQDEEMKEIEEILAAIDADPVLREVQAPPELREKVFAQIREYEEQKRLESLSEEDREWIRLGKIYRKRRKWNKVAVLIAAVVTLLAIGTVSMGENESILSYFKKMFAGGEQTFSDSGSTEPTLFIEEEDVFGELEEKYEFTPVRLWHLPEKTFFQEAVFCEDAQGVNIYYGTKDKANIIYIIRPNYREASLGTIIEDEKVQEYIMTVNDVKISLTEYIIEDSGENRWSIGFVYENVQYLLRITNMEQAEVEKIVNHLGFKKGE